MAVVRSNITHCQMKIRTTSDSRVESMEAAYSNGEPQKVAFGDEVMEGKITSFSKKRDTETGLHILTVSYEFPDTFQEEEEESGG